MMQKRDVWGFLVILGLLVSVSSAGVIGQDAMKQKSGWTPPVGGKSAITAVVDEFVARVAADKRTTASSRRRRRILSV